MKKWLLAVILLLTAVPPAVSQTVIRFALPTPETHPRNQALAVWADTVARESGGQLVVALQHGVTDYDGERIAAAVADGIYDMAAPGWWHLAQHAPGFGLPSLPVFYGRELAPVWKVFDGAVGQALKERLEQALRVRVLGRGLDLGFGHIYTAGKPVKSYDDLEKLNIRVPGGSADLARYLVFDATPRRIAMHDLADALRRNLVGGLLTTHNVVADSALWEVGVNNAFLDNQVFYFYVPIVNRTRWEALFDEERTWLAQAWEATIGDMRRRVADRQARARAFAAQKGVTYVEATLEQRKTMRTRLLEEQPAIVKALGIDPDLVAQAQAALTAAETPAK